MITRHTNTDEILDRREAYLDQDGRDSDEDDDTLEDVRPDDCLNATLDEQRRVELPDNTRKMSLKLRHS